MVQAVVVHDDAAGVGGAGGFDLDPCTHGSGQLAFQVGDVGRLAGALASRGRFARRDHSGDDLRNHRL
ncbi:MAG: hypothetical protein LLG03_09885 [Planctomycetaceae bacterium]|nr:hypothetical protein [Planctomycetaceae bacterium]